MLNKEEKQVRCHYIYIYYKLGSNRFTRFEWQMLYCAQNLFFYAGDLSYIRWSLYL